MKKFARIVEESKARVQQILSEHLANLNTIAKSSSSMKR